MKDEGGRRANGRRFGLGGLVPAADSGFRLPRRVTTLSPTSGRDE